MSYWDRLDRHGVEAFWMSHPRVRERINLRVSGDRAVWPTTWLARRLAGRLPLARVASLGSGTGALERDLVRQGIARRVEGVELSAACVVEAERLAAAEGVASRIVYHRADARDWIDGERDLDAVFFHGSLHHFDRLDDLLAKVGRALAADGLLYLDEYVGPARDEWRLRHLLRWNLVYYRLPRALRRARVVRAPRNDEDPTESVASSSILAAVERRFDLLERRDYGGQLVAWLYPYLARADERAHERAVEWLLDLEERSPRARADSHHAVVLARPCAHAT